MYFVSRKGRRGGGDSRKWNKAFSLDTLKQNAFVFGQVAYIFILHKVLKLCCWL